MYSGKDYCCEGNNGVDICGGDEIIRATKPNLSERRKGRKIGEKFTAKSITIDDNIEKIYIPELDEFKTCTKYNTLQKEESSSGKKWEPWQGWSRAPGRYVVDKNTKSESKGPSDKKKSRGPRKDFKKNIAKMRANEKNKKKTVKFRGSNALEEVRIFSRGKSKKKQKSKKSKKSTKSKKKKSKKHSRKKKSKRSSKKK